MQTAHPRPTYPALTALAHAGRALLATIVAVIAHIIPATPLPSRHARNPVTAQPRIARTLEWIEALTRTLAGDRHFLRPILFPAFPGRYPALTAQLRAEIGLPPLPPPTEAQRAAGRLHTIRKVFARDATGIIAARLARRLGLTPTDPAWPTDLIPLTQTPAQLANTKPPAITPPTPPPENLSAEAEPTPPPFHKRE